MTESKFKVPVVELVKGINPNLGMFHFCTPTAIQLKTTIDTVATYMAAGIPSNPGYFGLWDPKRQRWSGSDSTRSECMLCSAINATRIWIGLSLPTLRNFSTPPDGPFFLNLLEKGCLILSGRTYLRMCHPFVVPFLWRSKQRLAEDTSLPKMPTQTATPRGVATPRQDEHSLAGVPMSEDEDEGRTSTSQT